MAKFEYMEKAFSSELRPRARLALQVLVLHCNKEGECFPSIKTIAAKCGYGISTVKRALDELVEAGHIIKQARFDERKNGGQTSKLYTLCAEVPGQPEPEPDQTKQTEEPDHNTAAEEVHERTIDRSPLTDRIPGEQSAYFPLSVYSFAKGPETITGRLWDRPDSMRTGGSPFLYPLEPYR